VHLFVEAMEAFYQDFAPQRAAAAAATSFAEKADAALVMTEEVVSFSCGLRSMYEPVNCEDLQGVEEACSLATSQVVALASCGLALSAPHVEYMRRAVDSAGLALLSRPPAADPYSRLRWAEAAMTIQLAPLPFVTDALATIGRSLNPAQLLALGEFAEPPRTEDYRSGLESAAERLLAGVNWVARFQVE